MVRKDKDLLAPEQSEEVLAYDEMSQLVKYIADNIPIQELAIDDVGIFATDAKTLFNAMLSPNTINVPIVLYRVSKSSLNFYNYDLKLIGGMIFSEDLGSVKIFGKEFMPKSGWANYQLMNLDFDYRSIISLTEKKFQRKGICNLKK